MEKFRQLSAGEESMLVDNYRHIQPLNSRRVFVRVINGNSEKYIKYNAVHYTKWDWLGNDPVASEENEI